MWAHAVICRSENNLKELVLSFHHVGPENGTQHVKPGCKPLSLLSHLVNHIFKKGCKIRGRADSLVVRHSLCKREDLSLGSQHSCWEAHTACNSNSEGSMPPSGSQDTDKNIKLSEETLGAREPSRYFA